MPDDPMQMRRLDEDVGHLIGEFLRPGDQCFKQAILVESGEDHGVARHLPAGVVGQQGTRRHELAVVDISAIVAGMP